MWMPSNEVTESRAALESFPGLLSSYPLSADFIIQYKRAFVVAFTGSLERVVSSRSLPRVLVDSVESTFG